MNGGAKRAVTVVVTAHNLEGYIGGALGELYRQTMDDFDILVVDDASTDHTVQAVEEWVPRFGGRLVLARLDKNLGMPALARNWALDSGCIGGEYVIFLDGDDSIEPDMLEKLYTAAVSRHADAVICAYDRVDAGGGEVLSTEMRGFAPCMELPPSDGTLAFVNTAPWNKLWRYEVVAGLRYPAVRVGEEVPFNMAAYSRCRRVAFVDDVLVHYRVRAGSVISGTKEGMVWAFAEEAVRCYETCSGAYKDVAGLTAFIHIGLSMALRAADDPDTSLGRHVERTRAFFGDQFGWMRGNRLFRLRYLCRHGVRGIAVWLAFMAYRFGFFAPMLRCYRVLGRACGRDIRF